MKAKAKSGMTRAQYAAHRRCDPKEVRNALASGRIRLKANGKIDAATADADWLASTNPASATKPKPGLKPVAADAIAAARDVLRSAGEKVDATGMTFVQARTANEIVKAQLGQLRLKERERELVSRPKATNAVFALARQMRDALQLWPPRVSATLAAEFGIDAHALETALAREVKSLLKGLSAVDVDRVMDILSMGKAPQ